MARFYQRGDDGSISAETRAAPQRQGSQLRTSRVVSSILVCPVMHYVQRYTHSTGDNATQSGIPNDDAIWPQYPGNQAHSPPSEHRVE